MKKEREETKRKRLENLVAAGEEGEDNLSNQEDSVKSYKVAGAASKPTQTRPLNMAERKRKERKALVDSKRKEIYGEGEVQKLKNQRVEAFLNHSLTS